MAVKSILTTQSDFTGEFPITENTTAMWRMNEEDPTDNLYLADSTSNNRSLEIANWVGTTAGLMNGKYGRYFRMNINNPTTEKVHLIARNDGSFFVNMTKKLVIGAWIAPTTYSIGNTYCPLMSTRNGTGQPLFYLSLFSGRIRTMLYNAAGSLIADQTEPTMGIALRNGSWFFISTVIDTENKTYQTIIGDRTNGTTWTTPLRSFTGTLNQNCTADIVFGMLNNTYYYAGSIDDWFFEINSDLTIADLKRYFTQSLLANGGDSSADIDALSVPNIVSLKRTNNVYPSNGILITIATECDLAGNGRISVTSEYVAGETAISLIETATSDDFEDWSAWTSVGISGELNSPNRQWIKYRITLTTTDTSKTPRLLDIQLHDIPKAPYEKLGFARPVVLDENSAWEAVLENAFDVIVTSEINGADILEFKLPFQDEKRSSLNNEKQVQIVDDIYRIRTISDEKGSDGKVITSVYAEASFYDLSFSEEKQPIEFNADTADAPIRYALLGTGWDIGTVNVTSKRTWECSEKNALAILRMVQNLHGGDLIFDSSNRLVSLLSFSGTDSGALFAYRKNMKSIQRIVDTRSLVTRLYAYGKDGMTFASINNGNEYVEDYTYTNEVRIATLDCSSFTNPYQMLEFANMRLSEYAYPRVSYVMSAIDLSALTGYEHEAWKLGDIVTVDDRDLNLSIKTRVVRCQYNLQEPWKTVLELSTTLRELGDSSAQWDKMADVLSSTDLLDRQEIKDMVPFNHLRNSRADDNFAYWLNSGFEIDATTGVSGTASFKASGVSGMTKSLSQTVYPASRQNYTFSAQIASENLQRGSSGQVGIEVTIEYEDGSTEVRFIDLF